VCCVFGESVEVGAINFISLYVCEVVNDEWLLKVRSVEIATTVMQPFNSEIMYNPRQSRSPSSAQQLVSVSVQVSLRVDSPPLC
jgi:hypothetical protein